MELTIQSLASFGNKKLMKAVGAEVGIEVGIVGDMVGEDVGETDINDHMFATLQSSFTLLNLRKDIFEIYKQISNKMVLRGKVRSTGSSI